MLFSSLTFLFLFFPLVVLLYFVSPNRKVKNIVLLIASLLFYSWGEPKNIFLMLFEVVVSYVLALQIEKSEGRKRRNYLILECVIVFGFLFFYKYFNFFVEELLQIQDFSLTVALPIGISFYSFQILSYIFDVYRKKVEAQRNVFNLALYVSLFPQLIAGPIVRYITVEDELQHRTENFDEVADGIRRFIVGLGKKIIISNHMAIVADFVFLNENPAALPNYMCWLGAVSFMFQIYFDFSGYSDMAIGLGKIFGFHFLENFDYPYLSTSVTEFWRRWHMSLGTWFRDYVYIPLGGSRVSKPRWILNIFIVWFLTGLWHGAAWTFILWGLYYGILLMLEKTLLKKFLTKVPPFLKLAGTNLLVLLGWVIFNAPSLDILGVFLSKMFSFPGNVSRFYLNNINILYLWPYYILAILGCFPWVKKVKPIFEKKLVLCILRDIALAMVFGLCVMYLINNTYNPFIYFRF